MGSSVATITGKVHISWTCVWCVCARICVSVYVCACVHTCVYVCMYVYVYVGVCAGSRASLSNKGGFLEERHNTLLPVQL